MSAGLERPSGDGTADQEYVSIRELSRRIPYAEGSIRNLMSRGALRLGEHYVKPQGRVMFRWRAIRAWLEAERRGG
jgi:hypothetical protein